LHLVGAYIVVLVMHGHTNIKLISFIKQIHDCLNTLKCLLILMHLKFDSLQNSVGFVADDLAL
jgi:hypothetical protein